MSVHRVVRRQCPVPVSFRIRLQGPLLFFLYKLDLFRIPGGASKYLRSGHFLVNLYSFKPNSKQLVELIFIQAH